MPTHDAIRLRNWAVRSEDIPLPLEEIARGNLRQEDGAGNRRAILSGDIDPPVALALHSACLMQLEFHQLDRRWENAPSYGMKRLAPADWKSYRLAFCGCPAPRILPAACPLARRARSWSSEHNYKAPADL